ncbi:carboxymuconolactone decarboxylase family protein [Silvibacterium acidisoli]|uniref:carboxymuconolactone decarboxylase family protein n=1 Tax=Acidobacteriaceae bacterium ZG23-2 TaxID=2883246 RepID=UPI00406C4F24
MSSNTQQGRIRMLERDEVAAELTPLYDKLLAERGVVPNMFKTVANVPELALGFAAFLKPLMETRSLECWYKELIAARVAYLNDCEYCISSHTHLAKLAGARPEQVEGMKNFEAGPFTDAEKAGFRYADRLHKDTHAIDDAAYAAAKNFFTDAQMIELTAVAAAFEFFPRFVSALEVPVTPIPDAESVPANS